MWRLWSARLPNRNCYSISLHTSLRMVSKRLVWPAAISPQGFTLCLSKTKTGIEASVSFLLLCIIHQTSTVPCVLSCNHLAVRLHVLIQRFCMRDITSDSDFLSSELILNRLLKSRFNVISYWYRSNLRLANLWLCVKSTPCRRNESGVGKTVQSKVDCSSSIVFTFSSWRSVCRPTR